MFFKLPHFRPPLPRSAPTLGQHNAGSQKGVQARTQDQRHFFQVKTTQQHGCRGWALRDVNWLVVAAQRVSLD